MALCNHQIPSLSVVLSGIQSSAKVSTVDNGQYGMAGKGAWPMFCGEEMRRGMGCGGLEWEEGIAVVC